MLGIFNDNRFFPFTARFFLILLALISVLAFKSDEIIHRLAEQIQQKLSTCHGVESENLRIKKCEITVSDDGFLRYRKTYLNGKQEYYSINLSRLQSVEYLGSTDAGHLTVRSQEEDVIVQTYNDRTGNVDSMSMHLDIAFKTVEPEDLVSLQHNLFEIKRLLNQ